MRAGVTRLRRRADRERAEARGFALESAARVFAQTDDKITSEPKAKREARASLYKAAIAFTAAVDGEV